MSIAQYLPPNDLEFDLLVIDEASQIRPEDALGAIARSKQLVVVGDPKQMPPGRAFEKVAGEELEENKDDELALQDSESILDVALPLFAKRRLRWHYRSKHQSLIAFSNYSFYDDDLVVFPSPQGESDQYGVSYKRVSAGTFVNQQNIEEANQVALALKNQLMQHPEESVGVVAMSAKQQQAIEIAVEALAKSDRAFEAVLEARRSGTDSWFIKNLVDCFLFKLGRVTNPFAHFYLS
jgi:ATP-dependent exoDNAse (exonuclease V) alpha subunit